MNIQLYFVLIFLVIIGCRQSEVNENNNIEFSILSAEPSNSKLMPELNRDVSKDALKQYLSNYDLSNCQTLKKLLLVLFKKDQLYRDSINYYRKLGDEKSRSFGWEMTKLDLVNQKILKLIIQDVVTELKCLNSEKEIDALWLIAHHSNNNNLMKAVRPAVDYACERNFIRNDAYNLYYKKFNAIY